MTKQASLPMYDFPEIRGATDDWWTGIAKHMRRAGVKDVPAQLRHDVAIRSLWQNDELLFSQCCGFDVVYGFKNSLSVLMTSDWAAEGCHNGYYTSWIVVHEDSPHQHIADLFNGVAVINSSTSHSGMNSLLSLVAPYSKDGLFFKRIHESGAHAASLLAVQQKTADVAAIDCVTYALLKTYRPAAVAGIRIIGQSDIAPALPYVTRSSTPEDTQRRMQDALRAAFSAPALDNARATLLLKQGLFDRCDDYQKIADNFSYDARLLDVIT